MPKDTILDPIPKIIEAQAVEANRKDEMANPPFRSGIPKTRWSRRKKLPMVDSAGARIASVF